MFTSSFKIFISNPKRTRRFCELSGFEILELEAFFSKKPDHHCVKEDTNESRVIQQN